MASNLYWRRFRLGVRRNGILSKAGPMATLGGLAWLAKLANLFGHSNPVSFGRLALAFKSGNGSFRCKVLVNLLNFLLVLFISVILKTSRTSFKDNP